MNIQFQPSARVPFPCPLKETSQSKGTVGSQSKGPATSQYASKLIRYDNPLHLSKAAYALQQNVLTLTRYWRTHRLLELSVTFPRHVTNRTAQRRLNSFLTNVIRPIAECYVRVTGRTRKGMIHYHVTFAMEDYFGKRPSGCQRLHNLRRSLVASASSHGLGRITVRRVRDVEAWSIYLARHVDAPRLRADRSLRRVAYSQNFQRVCTTSFSWITPFATRWRNAVRAIARKYGISPTASRQWIWLYFKEITKLANTLPLTSPNFEYRPRKLTWQGKVWTVLRFQENPDLFLLRREAEGDERFPSYDPRHSLGETYRTFSVHVSRRELQRIVNAQRIALIA